MSDYRLGIILGAAFVILIALFIFLMVKAGRRSDRNFDERQIQVHGTAYKIGFFTLVGYNLVYGFICAVLDFRIFDEATGYVVGLAIALGIFASYCIWKDAYFSINDNPKITFISLGLLSASNIFNGVTALLSGEAIENGVFTFRSSGLFFGGMCFFSLIVSIIKSIHDRKQD